MIMAVISSCVAALPVATVRHVVRRSYEIMSSRRLPMFFSKVFSCLFNFLISSLFIVSYLLLYLAPLILVPPLIIVFYLIYVPILSSGFLLFFFLLPPFLFLPLLCLLSLPPELQSTRGFVNFRIE